MIQRSPSTPSACGSLACAIRSCSPQCTRSFICVVCASNLLMQCFITQLSVDPSVCINSVVAQLTALPLGKGLERILPTTRFRTFGFTWSLNPGPFTIKEHVLITVMANMAFSGAYATLVSATQRTFYNQTFSDAYQFLLVLATQLIGFSMGGLLRRFLVYPCSMICPGALVNSALFNTLHRTYGTPECRHISRQKFFAIVVLGSFLWYFVPGYLWTSLSVFNWACWIAPANVAVNSLFGTSTGLGMGLLTFDWSMISYIGSPLVTPVCFAVQPSQNCMLTWIYSGGRRQIRPPAWWSASGSLHRSFTVSVPPLTTSPLIDELSVTNTWCTQFLPISATSIFDNTGVQYDPTRIVTNGNFDESKYAAYSPAFIPATFAITYGVGFASLASTVVHTLCTCLHTDIEYGQLMFMITSVVST